MKVSDYIVEYLIYKGVKNVFGYPGGMVTHLMDSLGKYENDISTHITCHEQGASFAACGYAQACDYQNVGVAFATSGPGATNLMTGICNAYFDSIPVIFITGQVNTFESKGKSDIRQKGFQETDIISMVKNVTKYAQYVGNKEDIKYVLDKAFNIALSGRKGPVVLDIPMNIFREDIDPDVLKAYDAEEEKLYESSMFYDEIKNELSSAKRPCILIGNGIKIAGLIDKFRQIVRKCPIPVVSSMLAVDVIPEEGGLEGTYYGFVGAYGNRTANFVVAKSDLLICLGTRLDVRQVGAKRQNFAPQAKIIRADIDEFELENRIREDEKQYILNLEQAIHELDRAMDEAGNYSEWLAVCQEIKKRIKYIDEKNPNRVVNYISRHCCPNSKVVADVGQNMVWVAQSFRMRTQNRVFMSGGHGSMGYSLPAAIGIYYATGDPVICFSGDGGFQMNIQELEVISREKLPIVMVVLNNQSLGMIRHFQEMYFDSAYYYTTQSKGYTAPDFVAVARAYGIDAVRINANTITEELPDLETITSPLLIEVILSTNTIVSPKLEFGKPNQDQEPLLDRELYQYLMSL